MDNSWEEDIDPEDEDDHEFYYAYADFWSQHREQILQASIYDWILEAIEYDFDTIKNEDTYLRLDDYNITEYE